MKTYHFNLGVDVWIKDVEIEADSEEEARDKLARLSLEDMMETGYIKSEDICDVDVEAIDDDDEDDDDE